MNDVKPPRKPQLPPLVPLSPQPETTVPPPTTEPIEHPKDVRPFQLKPKRRFRWLLVTLLALLGLLIIAVIGSLIWYRQALAPVNTANTDKIRVVIAGGSTPQEIGALLKRDNLIRSERAFDIYTRVKRVQGALRAGTYSLTSSSSTPEIVDHLVSGTTDTFNITFLPGATLTENKQVLRDMGYPQAEVDQAFAGTYSSLLFAGKPAGADLEGYIYGETYNFPDDATVSQILGRTFDEYKGVVQSNNLEAGFASHGLSLYQGITLASIVQREASTPDDQKQVAAVFYNRLAADMTLGSDVTAYYGADKIGAARSVDVDTPYNTRLHAGLPPGPIATPGLSALKAVAAPATSDYLYFLSGDDDKLYLAKTNDEHEANIAAHCHVKCAIP